MNHDLIFYYIIFSRKIKKITWIVISSSKNGTLTYRFFCTNLVSQSKKTKKKIDLNSSNSFHISVYEHKQLSFDIAPIPS